MHQHLYRHRFKFQLPTLYFVTDRTNQLKDEEFIQDAQVCVMEARKNLYTKGSEEEGMYHFYVNKST